VTLVVNPNITEVLAGQTVALTLEASGQNLRFKWSASRGKLSAFDTPAVIYTAPDTTGVDTVTVEVSSSSGTTIENVSFNIVVPSPITTTSPPTITITSPLAEVVCPLDDVCYFDATGASSGVASDPDLEVIIFVRDGLWWPHKGFFVRSDGTWDGRAQIGDQPCWSIGHDFAIVAVVMTREQANRIPTEFQPLPEEYVARSDVVELVTTYDPVPIDLSAASASPDTGSSITLSAVGEKFLVIDYDLGTGGWVQVPVPVNQNMACMKELKFSITFSLQGTGAANTLEVKLEDADGTNYGWLSKPGGSVTANGETMGVPLDDFVFWWGNEGMNWQQVANVVFAVAKKQVGDASGAGQVIVSDVVMVPPVTP